MTAQVIDINVNKPHLAGKVRCLSCKYEYQGVCPVGIVHGIECPKCGLEQGAFINLCFPADAKYWECTCGNAHFIIEEGGATTCAHCGEVQRFP